MQATSSRRSAMVLTLALLVGLLLSIALSSAQADMPGEINDARAEGCGGRPGVKPPLRSSAKLANVARRLQRGTTLRDAMHAEGYVGIKSSSMKIRGRWLTDASVARSVSKNFCSMLIDAQLREIGIHRKGNEVWIVLAQPLSAPAFKDWPAVSRRVLELTNDARAKARRCGSERFEAAGPLMLSAALNRAALAHSRDMARRDYFEHESRDGSQPAERVTRAGYKWRVTGENLAAGVTTPEDAVEGWLKSPHHCSNLMDPRFTEMGIAFAVEPASSMAVYWTQVFALPAR